MVLADSCEAIRAAVSDLLEDAKCVCGEQFFFGASGEASSVPPSYMRFDAPLTDDAKV